MSLTAHMSIMREMNNAQILIQDSDTSFVSESARCSFLHAWTCINKGLIVLSTSVIAGNFISLKHFISLEGSHF